MGSLEHWALWLPGPPVPLERVKMAMRRDVRGRWRHLRMPGLWAPRALLRAKSRLYRAHVQYHAARQWDGPPLTMPLRVRMVFFLPRPARMIWKRKPMPAAPVAGKPDLSNLVKAIEDALNGRVWRDDAQLVELAASKFYAAAGPGSGGPGVALEVFDQSNGGCGESSQAAGVSGAVAR